MARLTRYVRIVFNDSTLILISRKMCILLTYVGADDDKSDYSYILASNRDEFYDRPARNMGPWVEDPTIYGGRDLQPGCDGGTWLAVSPLRHRIGVLLNIPCVTKENAKSRGSIVSKFVKGNKPMNDYVNSMKNYFKECNEFILVGIELGKTPVTQTYCSTTNRLDNWNEECLGFGNCHPEEPLKKVVAAKSIMKEICTRLNKVDKKAELIEELINFLKSKERHLPDPHLKKTRPNVYEQLSSVFVEIPAAKYGTRTHTVILVMKTGHVDVIELSMQSPIDLSNPNWQRTEFHFNI